MHVDRPVAVASLSCCQLFLTRRVLVSPTLPHPLLTQDLLQRSCMLAQSQRRLEQQSVLAAISSSGHLLGCDGGRPVAALLIHR